MSMLLGIVLFVLICGFICLGGLTAYYTMVAFDETGGMRGFRTSQDGVYWRKRAYAWRLMSVTSFIGVIVCGLVIFWLTAVPAMIMVILCVAVGFYVISWSISTDLERRATRYSA